MESNMPIIFRLEKAKSDIREFISSLSKKYDIPQEVVTLLVESVISEEYARQLGDMASQVSLVPEVEDDITKED